MWEIVLKEGTTNGCVLGGSKADLSVENPDDDPDVLFQAAVVFTLQLGVKFVCYLADVEVPACAFSGNWLSRK